MKALSMFKLRLLVSTSMNDHLVSYSTASIRGYNPYNKPVFNGTPEFNILGIHGKYAQATQNYLKANCKVPIGYDLLGTEMKKWDDVLSPKKQKKKFRKDNLRQVEYLEKMLTNLHQLSWNRIDVEFVLHPMHSLQVHVMPLSRVSVPNFLGKNQVCSIFCINPPLTLFAQFIARSNEDCKGICKSNV